jgi:hypothetical protein
MIIVLVPVVLLFVVLLVKKIPFIGGNILVALGITGLAISFDGRNVQPNRLAVRVDRRTRPPRLDYSVVGSRWYLLGNTDEDRHDGNRAECLKSQVGPFPQGLDYMHHGGSCDFRFSHWRCDGVLRRDRSACYSCVGGNAPDFGTDRGGRSLRRVLRLNPPITQAIVLASSLTGVDPEPVMRIWYVTVGITLIVCIVYMANVFVKIKALPEDLIPKKKANEILRENGKTLLPLLVLVVLVVLRTGFKIDVATMIFGPFLTWFSSVKILKGLSNLIVFN